MKDPGPRAKAPRTNVTAKDIAAFCGVSTATISYVLNDRATARVSEGTRQRVLEAAKVLGYRRNHLAAALRTGRMHTVGIVCPLPADHSDRAKYTYLKDLMIALSVASAERGLNSVFFVDRPLASLPLEEIADRRVDGAILFGMYEGDKWVQALYETRLPCVEIGSIYGPFHVLADNYNGGRQAAEHLLKLGHRRIANWTGMPGVVSAESRGAGFRDALMEAGVRPEEAPVFDDGEVLKGLLRKPDRPTAVFTYNDEHAVLALDTIHAAGLRVPQDISLMGFDNDLRAAVMRPALTTMQNPIAPMAEEAVRLLQGQIDGNATVDLTSLLPISLVKRDSTGPAPTL